MVDEQEPKDGGVDLQTACKIYVSSDLLAQLNEASETWDARERSYPGWRNSRKWSYDDHGEFREIPDELTENVRLAWQACENYLRERLAADELVAWGTQGSEAGTRIPIQSFSWDKLRFDYPRSRIRARGVPAVVYFDVRVYEREAENRHQRLPPERNPVSKGIAMAYNDLVAQGEHLAWQSVTQAQRAIRQKYDQKGDDKNARKMVADRLGDQIRKIVEENQRRLLEGNQAGNGQQKQG